MSPTEKLEEADIEAVLERERIPNHELGWTALDFIRDREGEPLPILEKPTNAQLRYTIYE